MSEMQIDDKQKDTMIQLQLSIVTKIIKTVFPDKVITADFKKQFCKALSLFILFIQNGQTKKKYGRDDIITVLEQQGLAKVVDNLRKNTQLFKNENSQKKIISAEEFEHKAEQVNQRLQF